MAESHTFIGEYILHASVQFEKRDGLLVAGVGLLAVGMVPFVAPVYALVIAAVAFFGIKWYSVQRQKQILSEVGDGMCAQCGSAVYEGKCPQCDSAQDSGL